MKKLLSILLLMAVLISCCGCGAKDRDDISALDPQSPEALYGHIDQTVPIDGYYKIWNPEGIRFMMETGADGKFEILCNIDMQGATLAPMQTLTGSIKGGNFTVSNFVLQGGDETDFGFVGINEGNISNLLLKDITFVPGEKARNIGAFAGTNTGKINRCEISGQMAVTAAAADAACGSVVGANTGAVTNVVATVDVTYSAEGAAKVGGLVGTTQGGALEYVETHGKLTVTGTNKQTGLFAGDASGVVISNCVFSGADNSLDGKLFINFTGNGDDEAQVVTGGKWRDNAAIEPLPDNVTALRSKVVQAMYDMCTVEWRVTEDLVHSCTCQLSTCHGVYNTMYTYYGIPYNHKSSSLARFQYCLNADGTVADWFYDLAPYDGFDIYIGSDCSSCLQQAWWTVSNSSDIRNTRYAPEVYGQGTVTVGDYKCDFELQSVTVDGASVKWTDQYINANSEQTIYESYAAMRPGDAIVNQVKAGGHVRMIASNPVIVRDQAGQIDPQYSYVLTHEQGSNTLDEVNMTSSSCKVNWKYTFANLYFDWYVPFTIQELISGEMEPVEATVEGGCDGYAGIFTGQIKSNYHLDSVTLAITDAEGKTVLEHPIFATVQKTQDYGDNYYTCRSYTDSMDLADFAVVMTKVPLELGGSYRYTLTANLATFDDVVVAEGSFTYGS